MSLNKALMLIDIFLELGPTIYVRYPVCQAILSGPQPCYKLLWLYATYGS